MRLLLLHAMTSRELWIFRSLEAVSKEAVRSSLSGVQLGEQRLGLLQIERVETFGEPAIDRSEKRAGRIPFALIAPQPRDANRAQFPRLCLLLRQVAQEP